MESVLSIFLFAWKSTLGDIVNSRRFLLTKGFGNFHQ